MTVTFRRALNETGSTLTRVTSVLEQRGMLASSPSSTRPGGFLDDFGTSDTLADKSEKKSWLTWWWNWNASFALNWQSALAVRPNCRKLSLWERGRIFNWRKEENRYILKCYFISLFFDAIFNYNLYPFFFRLVFMHTTSAFLVTFTSYTTLPTPYGNLA